MENYPRAFSLTYGGRPAPSCPTWTMLSQEAAQGPEPLPSPSVSWAQIRQRSYPSSRLCPSVGFLLHQLELCCLCPPLRRLTQIYILPFLCEHPASCFRATTSPQTPPFTSNLPAVPAQHQGGCAAAPRDHGLQAGSGAVSPQVNRDPWSAHKQGTTSGPRAPPHSLVSFSCLFCFHRQTPLKRPTPHLHHPFILKTFPSGCVPNTETS